MKAVSYLRPRANFTRTLRVSDLARLGIEHKEDMVFSPTNKFTIVMSNKTSDSLVAALPKEFKAYPADGDDESPEVQEPLTSLQPSGSTEGESSDSLTSSDPEDDPDSSEDAGDAQSASSTRKGSRKP